jgi:PAS domain S-box-containing protein
MDAQTGIISEKNKGKETMERHYEPTMIEIELDESGIIRNCNGICEELVGFTREELVSKPISMLIRKLSEYQIILNHNLNPVLDYICHCGMPFQMKNKAGDTFYSEIRFVYLSHLRVPKVRLLATPMAPGYNGPLMMA